jgi:hypothetical protein
MGRPGHGAPLRASPRAPFHFPCRQLDTREERSGERKNIDENRQLIGDTKAALEEVYAGRAHFYISSGELPSPWGNGGTVPSS